jgi:hypothetical protein
VVDTDELKQKLENLELGKCIWFTPSFAEMNFNFSRIFIRVEIKRRTAFQFIKVKNKCNMFSQKSHSPGWITSMASVVMALSWKSYAELRTFFCSSFIVYKKHYHLRLKSGRKRRQIFRVLLKNSGRRR